MPVSVIQDLRWGDTGKGKISEYLSHPDRCSDSVRCTGGGNAGHMVIRGTRKQSLHLLPAGCLHEGVNLVLGRGMVTHLPTLLKEIEDVQNTFGTDPLSRLHIAKENHILFEGHKAADAELERRKGERAVGTTKSGIGPAYADKALRYGMRMEILQQPAHGILDHYRRLLEHWKNTYGVTLDEEKRERDVNGLLRAKELLEGRIHDLTAYWRRRFQAATEIVIEGAQGALLSIDSEGYPYVTSSATTVHGSMQGAGIPHRELTKVIGTLKLYDTRVGAGPMRTRLTPELEAQIQERGEERGSTTGRIRRVGWLDLEDTEQRAWEEGVHELAVLKGDVLDPQRTIPMAITSSNGETPEYTEFPGWNPCPIRGLRDDEALPSEARSVYNFIGDFVKVPVRYIGTGPESSELIARR